MTNARRWVRLTQVCIAGLGLASLSRFVLTGLAFNLAGIELAAAVMCGYRGLPGEAICPARVTVGDHLTWAMLEWVGRTSPVHRASAYTLLGRLWLVARDPNQAQAWLAAAHQQAPTDLWAALLLGDLYDSQGHRAAALEAWMSAPEIAVRHVERGRRAALTQDWDRAAAEFSLAVEIDPRNPTGYRGLGQSYRAQGRPEESIQAYRQAIALGERDGYVYVELAHVLSLAGREAEAVALLDEVGAEDALAEAIRGNYYRRLGQFEVSARHLENSVRAAPNDPWTRHALAIVYLLQGQRAPAIHELRRALEIAPGFPPAQALLNCVTAAEDPRVCVSP